MWSGRSLSKIRGVFDPTPATIRLIERRIRLMRQGRHSSEDYGSVRLASPLFRSLGRSASPSLPTHSYTGIAIVCGGLKSLLLPHFLSVLLSLLETSVSDWFATKQRNVVQMSRMVEACMALCGKKETRDEGRGLTGRPSGITSHINDTLARVRTALRQRRPQTLQVGDQKNSRMAAGAKQKKDVDKMIFFSSAKNIIV